jgi:rRNA processing protein Krr1/Pno1
MNTDVQLISDGDGLAVIGNPTAVNLFLAAERLASEDLGLPRLGAVLGIGAEIAQAYSEIATSARWVKLTKESAHLVDKHGLTKSSKSGLRTGVVKQSKGKGQIGEFVEFAKDPVSQLSNPAVLSGAAGLMAQLAMQQTMDEITDYLATIDAKLDDVLRAQEDAVLADMIGVGFDIDEAMTLREHGGRVNEVTWSKVQGASTTIARTQAYALCQLDALAEKLERATKVSDLAETAKAAESKAGDWLAVLARCFQLQDAIAVLELDRVLEVAPDDLDGHRLGLKAVRQKRLDTISQTTERLLARMDAAAGMANAKVLLNPIQSPAVVRFEGTSRQCRHRAPPAAGDRVRWTVGGGEGMGGRRHGVQGQGARDRRRGRRRLQAPR